MGGGGKGDRPLKPPPASWMAVDRLLFDCSSTAFSLGALWRLNLTARVTVRSVPTTKDAVLFSEAIRCQLCSTHCLDYAVISFLFFFFWGGGGAGGGGDGSREGMLVKVSRGQFVRVLVADDFINYQQRLLTESSDGWMDG